MSINIVSVAIINSVKAIHVNQAEQFSNHAITIATELQVELHHHTEHVTVQAYGSVSCFRVHCDSNRIPETDCDNQLELVLLPSPRPLPSCLTTALPVEVPDTSW